MKLKNSSRRKFLKDANSLAITTGMMYGLDNLFQILMQNAVANAATDTSYKYRYINFLTSGGPPRWYFDQPLNPNNKDAEFNPGNFGTSLKKVGADWKAVHIGKAVKFGTKNIFMPPVWSLKSGGTGPAFADLLKETLMIRGLNMEINSHNVNRERTVRPFNSLPSITGLVGNLAHKPITAIGHAGASTSVVYKSPDGSAAVNVTRANPVPGISAPFQVNEIVKYDDLDYSVQQALSAIDNYAKDQRLPSQGNENVLKNSYDMFARKLDAFKTTYAALLAKYEAIVDKEVKAEFPDVTTDLASIKPDGSKAYQYTNNKFFSSTDNLKTILAAARPPDVAHAFAFAEFALKEDLTSALTLELGGSFANVKGIAIAQDQHFIGSITSTLFTSLYYRSVLGCMTELRKQLVSLNVWDKTVIQMASEFSRTPRTDGAGSDHGFESGSTSIMSGMIKTPALLGNIYLTPPAAMAERYIGTWGHAAPFAKDDGKMRNIINDDVVSTVCEMLQVEKVGTKGFAFVKNSNDKVELATGLGFNLDSKNVKRG
ncbi:MAG: DUF1501 domain-containing protein [Bdellovibrionaceae bacterium]|nr:DUF1501 domain-containing protein [Pseudobdellovibrionaceae bacterium]